MRQVAMALPDLLRVDVHSRKIMQSIALLMFSGAMILCKLSYVSALRC